MDAITEFLEMGGYGAYVWPAFAITTAIMIAMLWSTLRALRVNEAALAALQAAEPTRRSGSRNKKVSKR